MKPKQFFLILVGTFGVILLIAGVGYYMALEQLKAQSDKLSTGLATQLAADEQIERLSVLQRQYTRDIEPILPLIDDALPRDKKQTQILAQLQTIAAGVGLR